MKNKITEKDIIKHQELLSNRVLKRYKHMRKRLARQNIECFRLYDWDIPEVRAIVDWYKGHLVVGEYERTQSIDAWLPAMAEAVGEALGVDSGNVYIKRRHTGKSDEKSPRYRRMSSSNKRFQASERDLKFWINPSDFLDTGLFSDHRDTRLLIRDLAKDKKFLNLYAYTGAFSCAAALGGASKTVTVDRSETYIKWAQENLKLNGFDLKKNVFIQSDVDSFIKKASKESERFSLCVVDPPSFFQDRRRNVSFDINDDHPKLLENILKVMKTDGIVFFSTNHQRFSPRFGGLRIKELVEITPKTIPEDYRNKQIHRCWKMTVL